ncbi:hypothetical protein LCGC14_1898180 [marine sediment metagenome]|uniref:Uncharacterized protein n=1 Tax=marine sediment metagenome TaxID=412755 RepID=A0A0F9FXM9_9ZZZZ
MKYDDFNMVLMIGFGYFIYSVIKLIVLALPI